MATIPQAIDYGQRPSLRSNRVDRPDPGEADVADAIGRAAGAFAEGMIQHKEKADTHKYNVAKNEIQLEQMRLIEELKNDPTNTEFGTYEENYRKGMQAIRDKWGATITDANDRRILGLEGELITERGNASVGEIKRIREIDFEMGQMKGLLEKNLTKLQEADPHTRNDLMLTSLDLIDEQYRLGRMGHQEYIEIREKWTQTASRLSLAAMSRGEALRHLDATIAYREGTPGKVTKPIAQGLIEEGNLDLEAQPQIKMPDGRIATVRTVSFEEDGVEVLIPTVTPDGKILSNEDAIARYHETGRHLGKFDNADNATDFAIGLSRSEGQRIRGDAPLDADAIRKGEGTNSIADFLGLAEARDMRDKLRKEDKNEADRLAAQSAVGQARQVSGDPAEQRAWLSRNTSGMVEEIALRQFDSDIVASERINTITDREVHGQFSEQLRESAKPGGVKFTVEDIPTDVWTSMSESQKRDLISYEQQLGEDKQFAAVTNWKQEYDKNGVRIPDQRRSWSEWEAMTDEEMVAENLDGADWRTVLTGETYRSMVKEQELAQDRLDNPGTVKQETWLTPREQFAEGTVGAGMFKRTGRSPEEDELYQKALYRFINTLADESTEKWKGGEIPYGRRREILNSQMLDFVYERGIVYDNTTPIPIMNPGAAGISVDAWEDDTFYLPLVMATKEVAEVTGIGARATSDTPGAEQATDGHWYTDVRSISWAEKLTNQSIADNDGHVPTQEQIENAYAAAVAGRPLSEINKFLLGKGDD